MPGLAKPSAVLLEFPLSLQDFLSGPEKSVLKEVVKRIHEELIV